MAYGLLVWGLAIAAALGRSSAAPRVLRTLSLAAAAVLLLQVALGVATLRWGVPLPLAMAHQLTACALLASATVLAWQTRRVITVS
jgi:heme A synthase